MKLATKWTTALLLLTTAILWIAYGGIRTAEGLPPTPQPAGNGATPTDEVTASNAGDDEIEFDFLCINNHPHHLVDFGLSVSPVNGQAGAPKITEANMDADNNGTSDDTWDVDDNGNGKLDNANGEGNNVDASPGSSTHVINRGGLDGAVPNGIVFYVSGKVKLPKDSGNWQVRLTTTNLRKPAGAGGGGGGDEPMGGGTMADTVKDATQANNSFQSPYIDDFEWPIVGIYARNLGTATIRSVTVEPPLGALIAVVETVGEEMNDGIWNPVTSTFTFSSPIQPNTMFGLNVIFENLAGDQTFTWEVNY